MALTVKQIAEHLGGVVYGDDTIEIDKIATLTGATPGNISFLTNNKYRDQLAHTKASAVLINKDELVFCQQNSKAVAIVLDNPYLGYARLAQYMDTTPKGVSGIHPSAVISDSAEVAQSACIGANTVIADGAVIGENVVIGPGCYVGHNSRLGANTRLWANVSVYHGVTIGENCLFQSGAVIGSDGFGYAPQGKQWVKIPQLGGVVIGNNVEVGANSAIDRGALEDTLIENGVIIDNLCHVAHNVTLGENTAMAGGSMVAGSTKIGSNCALGGMAGVSGHLQVSDNVLLTAKAMVIKDIKEPGAYSSGIPSMPSREWRKLTARLRQLDDMHLRLRKAEKKLTSDESADK